MEKLLYSPLDLAIILQYHKVDVVRISEVLADIFRYDNAFIQPKYRKNLKSFMLAVMDELNSLNNQQQFDLEKEEIDKDLSDWGIDNKNSEPVEDTNHLIFKNLRIKILYINKQGFAKMKLRSLLASLGYKKRSPAILNYIVDCLLFYHISVSLRDNAPCIIDEISLDDTIIFRVI